MDMTTKEIIEKINECTSIIELNYCWVDLSLFVDDTPDRDCIIELKESLEEYLENKYLEDYPSPFSKKYYDYINDVMNLPLEEKRKLTALNIKKLIYYERI